MNLTPYKAVERAAYESKVLRLLDEHPEVTNGKLFVETLIAQGLETRKIREVVLDLLKKKVLELTEDKKFVRRCKQTAEAQKLREFEAAMARLSTNSPYSFWRAN